MFVYVFFTLFVSFSSSICRMKSNLTSPIVKISLKFDFYPLTDREREREISVGDSREKEETHARTSPAFMCPSKRGDTSTGLFVGFSRIPDVSAESFVPFARYAIEYFRDVFRLVSDSRIFIPLFLLDSITPLHSHFHFPPPLPFFLLHRV